MSQIKFDFNSIKERIKTSLSSKSEWSSFLDYGVADNILDPIVQELAYCMTYDEYLTNENWWQKARNKSSLLVQSGVHGYKIKRKIGAIGTLRISTSETFDEPYEKNVNIELPKFFSFSGNGIYVVTDSINTLLQGTNYLDISCVQGEPFVLNFVAEGNNFEERDVIDDSIENNLYTLTVNDVVWKCVDNLYEYGADDLVYELNMKSDLSGVTIRFGNDIFGKKLNNGDIVKFQYISTNGVDGNIYTSDVIDRVESQAFDINGKPVKLYVTNITSILGGKDYPSIDEIRELSPKVYQSGNRASSVEDYETLIKEFSYVSKIEVWGAYETNLDNGNDPWQFIPTEENVIHLACLNTEYNELDDTQKSNLISDLHSKCDPTDLISFESIEKIPLDFVVNATVKNSTYSLAEVKTNIENTLISNYGIANMNFNQNIYNSDMIAVINGVDGVRNHVTEIYLKKEGKFLTNGQDGGTYVGNFKLPIYPINYSKTSIYVKNVSGDENVDYPEYTLCAKLDYEGNFIHQGDFRFDNSNISSSGVGIMTFLSGLNDYYYNYQFKIVYANESLDLIMQNRSNIFVYNSSDITVVYPK